MNFSPEKGVRLTAKNFCLIFYGGGGREGRQFKYPSNIKHLNNENSFSVLLYTLTVKYVVGACNI